MRPTGQETQAEGDVNPSTYSNGHYGAVEAVEASPGDGAGVEGDQLAADGREGALDALQVLQQEQDTAVTHCRGTQQCVQHSPLLGFPPLIPQDSGTQTFTLHAVGAVCHQDLVLAQADVTLLPCEPTGARALPGARVTRAPSALTLCRGE